MFLPGESHGQRCVAGYSPWGRKESGRTEQVDNHRATAKVMKFKKNPKREPCGFSGKEGEGPRDEEARSLGSSLLPSQAPTSCLREHPLRECCPLPRSLGKPGVCCLSLTCHETRPVQSLAVSVGLRRSVRLLSGLLVFSLPAYLPRVVLGQRLSACVSSCFRAFDWLPWFQGEGQRPLPCLASAYPLASSPGCCLPLPSSAPWAPLSECASLTHTHTHTTADIRAHDLQARPRVLHESYVVVETALMVGPAIIPISAKALEALEWPAESLRSRSHQVA